MPTLVKDARRVYGVPSVPMMMRQTPAGSLPLGA